MTLRSVPESIGATDSSRETASWSIAMFMTSPTCTGSRASPPGALPSITRNATFRSSFRIRRPPRDRPVAFAARGDRSRLEPVRTLGKTPNECNRNVGVCRRAQRRVPSSIHGAARHGGAPFVPAPRARTSLKSCETSEVGPSGALDAKSHRMLDRVQPQREEDRGGGTSPSGAVRQWDVVPAHARTLVQLRTTS